jgi:phosphatidylglycerophosphatase A
MGGLAVFIATFGYVGYFPIAPGTAGSLAALLLYAVVRWAGTPAVELATMIAVLAIGIWAASGTERALDRKDPGAVVIDEVLGMLMTLAFMPLSWAGIAAGFVLFRIFDVIKPFPAGRLEHLPGGLGIMADDAMAGVYGQIVMRMAIAMWPAWLTM